MKELSVQKSDCATNAQESPCCCGPIAGPFVINRRNFLKISGAGFLATTLGGSKMIMAGPFDKNDMNNGHLVPVDKKLDPNWVKSLYARGTKEKYKGDVLKTIGMPCCGIASGQLYLCGDGTLGDWQLFGNAVSYWVGSTNSTFGIQPPRKPVQQGFAVSIKNYKGKNIIKKLSEGGVKEIEFQGEYPIGIVRYADKELPVKVQLEAYSPYIPLNAEDSAYPATVLEFTVENTSDETVNTGIMGWLGNAVCLNSRMEYDLTGKTTFVKNDEVARMTNSVELKKSDKTESVRPQVLFENFEGQDWGKWKVEGESFGDKPTRVSHLEGQDEVGAIDGEGYANSMHGSDKSKGKLTSKKFSIDRRYICFLLGGGGHATTNISLLVDGEIVRKSSGWNQEGLHWRGWYVGNIEGEKAQIVIEDAEERNWGHINVDSIQFTDDPKHGGVGVQSVDYGNMTLVCQDAGDGLEGMYPDSDDQKCFDIDGTYPLLKDKLPLLRSKAIDLKPGQKKTFRFVMSWYFPNLDQNGRMYAEKFKDSDQVASHIVSHYQKLRAETYLWHDILYDSTLPYWLLDRLHSTMSILATGTTRWWKNGRFYAFEGCTCCHGTCTHVWSYAQGHARLFPELARNIRERQDLMPIDEGGGFYSETGLVAFRGDKDFGFAADGQCGTVLNAYREHLMSADDAFLKKNWPKIKKALEYLIEQDAKGLEGGTDSPERADKAKSADARRVKASEKPDGIITGTQHNTYDLNYHGANTLVGALYLAALRAGEEMAKEVGDEKFASYSQGIFESGKNWTINNLWNGEYFVQDVDLAKHPTHQYKDGCLSDQIFGQFWAHQVGLGYIYPSDYVKKTMQSVWKYNWAPDVAPYNKEYRPFRWFINPGQAGLFTCTWPKSEYLSDGMSYKNEIWTGIEYQVAANLINEGLVTEGLAICRAIHDRYQPGFLNPYNEIECGDHYARAMASWGVYLALAGFKYHGPDGIVGFDPQITPENFKAAFTFAEGWASFSQERKSDKQIDTIQMQKGKLKLNELSFTFRDGKKAKSAEVKIDGKKINSTFKSDGGTVTIRLANTFELKEKQNLQAEIKV